MQGLVFNVERFAVHDGPGIRTLVFLKGCPLRCKWCSNPESWNSYPEVVIHRNRLGNYEQYFSSLPRKAITIDDWHTTKKNLHEKIGLSCTDTVDAVEEIGSFLTVEETVREVLRDEIFYKNSGGGTTLTGGEPTLQRGFVIDLLKSLKDFYVHTAIETSGYAEWKTLEQIFDLCDLILYDIKCVDPILHKEYTGVDNRLILENFERAANTGYQLVARIPLIPNHNMSEKDIKATIKFLGNWNSVKRVDLLPYHGLGVKKYDLLGLKYKPVDLGPPSIDQLAHIKKEFESQHFVVSIGGLL